ncbi:MAG: glycoside hydrolase family 43 protein [Acidimicrobiales bacterium]
MALITRAAPASAATWVPSINQDFPDPSVVNFGGVYYAYSTQVYYNIVPYAVSTDGVHWSAVLGDAMPNLATWASFGYSWAPSVAKNLAGEYVMFYVARDAQYGTECIGEAESSSPAGPFVDQNSGPVICNPETGGDIDPDIFTDQSTGDTYLIWKDNANVVRQRSSLWAVPLNANLDIDGSASELLASDQGWQQGDVEGPNMQEHDGTYYLFYGGNSYLSNRYSVGYATCASPLGPCSDSSNNPVLVGAGGMLGPGGPSLFFGSDGLEMAFSAWVGVVGYNYGGYRPMFLASVSFEAGLPVFDPVIDTMSSSSYWTFGAGGAVDAFASPSYGSHSVGGSTPVVGAAAHPGGGGYWTVTSDGAVYAFGDAEYFGGTSGFHLVKPIVGIAATPDGLGYWLVASDGGVFSFGDASFYGSMGGKPLAQPVVGIGADQATGGYWLVASDGGIFSFNAPFFGSTGNFRLNKPVVGMAGAPDGGGYWLVAADGGVFSFGDATFDGSTGNIHLNQPVVGMTPSPDGGGYWLVAADGGIFSFGDARFSGSTGGEPIPARIRAVAADVSS